MKYFGTDGIRRKADDFSSKFLRLIAKGLVDYGGNDIRVLIGGDTRESTEWIISDLETAFETLGIEYGTVGVLPTPSINHAFYEMGFDFAIDVTASHNPYIDNGIKIFERGEKAGRKLSERGCAIIESAIDADLDYKVVSTSLRENLHDEALAIYLNHLSNYLGKADFSEIKIGMDCADGATSVVGKKIFEELGATVELIHDDKSYGEKINNNCGSTHLNDLKTLVKTSDLDFGVAFDGDGDRVLMIDKNGDKIDGDQMIVILSEYLNLKSAVVTVMANQGIIEWAKEFGVSLEISAVGDQNVAKTMMDYNIPIGGEQSGHIILPNEATGDGMLTALMITKIISETKKNLSDLASSMKRFPQIMLNLEADKEQKEKLRTSEDVKRILLEFDKKIKEISGRLLVRPSGTENLIRVTMWGQNEKDITDLASSLIEKLKTIL